VRRRSDETKALATAGERHNPDHLDGGGGSRSALTSIFNREVTTYEKDENNLTFSTIPEKAT
jgi:hypothetical protein